MAGADKTLGDLFELAEAGGLGVKVGVLEGATHKAENGQNVHIIDYAMANEYGTRRIPPRAAFRTTADVRGVEWAEILGRLIQDGVDPRDALAQTGKLAAEDIATSISEWKKPRNAASTVARKGRDNPLVESGDLMNAVDFVLTGPGE